MATTTVPTPTRDELDAYGPLGRSTWLDEDWSEHLRWVVIDGEPVNLVDVGTGPPIVFVHGLGGSWQNWLENILPFAADHRVVALDLPGFGESPMPQQPIDIGRYADLLDGVMGALDINAAVVVGNSMGGLIAAEMALRHPQRVERLVLVAAAGLSPTDRFNPQAFAVFSLLEGGIAAFGASAARRALDVASREKLRRSAFSVVAWAPEILPTALVAEQIRGAGKPGFMPATKALLTYPIRERLDDVACPTLIVWGTHDKLVPVRDATEYEELIPNARKIIYPRTGHVPMLERPARFNADLRAFLTD
ncbi:MAG: alpha/beta hydrolase [Solirubrobacteraceae bacterium]|nr:alpha/beta hydrolase [Solirubrobacteraceae bacterium]